MIVDVDVLVSFISSWLAQYAEENGKLQFILPQSNSRRYILTHHLCSQATALRGGLKVCVVPNSENILSQYISSHNIASGVNGIVVGSIDKSFGLYSRTYKKSELGFIDICPLFDLEYSEIIEATTKLFPDAEFIEKEDVEKYRMLEFCNLAERQFGIITDENPPHKNTRWPFFTKQQKDWVAEIHQREKWTRHKIMTRPFPKIPIHICNGPGR